MYVQRDCSGILVVADVRCVHYSVEDSWKPGFEIARAKCCPSLRAAVFLMNQPCFAQDFEVVAQSRGCNVHGECSAGTPFGFGAERANDR